MSCDGIKIKDQSSSITIVNNKEVFEVEDKANVTKILNQEDVIEVKDEVGERVIINATDVLLSAIPQDVDMVCTSTEQVGDAVYTNSLGEVRQANNSDISTAKVTGFIISKASATSCKVRLFGLIDTFTGLDVGEEYFLSNISGDIDLTVPTTAGSVISRVGQAIKADLFFINLNNNYIIRS